MDSDFSVDNQKSFQKDIVDNKIDNNKYYAYHNGNMILCADTQSEIEQNSKVTEILLKNEIVTLGFVGKSSIITVHLNKTCIMDLETQSAL